MLPAIFVIPESREIIVRKNRKFTRSAIKQIQQLNIERISVDAEDVVGTVSAEDVVDENTGEVLLQTNETLTEEKIESLREQGVTQFKVLFIDGLNVGSYLRDTLLIDKVETGDEAILEIYRRLRPGDPPTLETARTLFNNLFFQPRALRLVARRSSQAEPQVQLGRTYRQHGSHQEGYHGGSALPP